MVRFDICLQTMNLNISRQGANHHVAPSVSQTSHVVWKYGNFHSFLTFLWLYFKKSFAQHLCYFSAAFFHKKEKENRSSIHLCMKHDIMIK